MSYSPVINLQNLLQPTDYIVFLGVIFATLAAVFWGHHRKKNLNPTAKSGFLDHMLMGRQLTMPMFVATLVATWYGGIFGVTQIAFESGIYNFITQGVFWYATYLIFAFFLVPRISRFQAVTLPDLVGRCFGPKSEKLAAVFNVLNVVPVTYVVSLGLLIQQCFGISFVGAMALGLALVIGYAIHGGLRSVVYSDIVQFGVMCTSVALIFAFSWMEFGGLNFLQEKLPETHFSPTGGQSLGTTFVWGLIALSTLVDPNFYQRCFAAESPQVAKKGIYVSTLIWICFDIATTAGGMYAAAVLPEASSGTAYLTYGIQLLPEGLRGFFIAGIAATILSTLDSYLFIGATTLSYDLLKKESMSPSIKTYTLSFLAVGLLAFLLGLGFEGNIRSIWKTLGSYSAACLLCPVVLGIFRPKFLFGNKNETKNEVSGKYLDHLFVGAALISAAVVTYWRNWPPFPHLDIDELYAGVASSLLVMCFGLLIQKFKKTDS